MAAAVAAAAAVAGGEAVLLGDGDLETDVTTGLRVLTLVTLRLTSEDFAVGPPFFFPRCEKNMMQKRWSGAKWIEYDIIKGEIDHGSDFGRDMSKSLT